jgi:levansucrase
MRTPAFPNVIGVAAVITLALTMAAGAVAAPPHDKANGPKAAPTSPDQFDPEGDFTANWTRAQALEVPSDMGPDTLKPEVAEDFPVMTEEVWIWDTWPLTDLDMLPLSYKGWEVIFSLTAPRDIFFGDRHWVATIGYFYRQDASQDWIYGGDLHNTRTPFAAREWAGSAILTHGNNVQSFYTASGSPESFGVAGDPHQRLATTSGKIRADKHGVSFTGFNDHEIIAEADGEVYQTLEQSEAGPIIYAFRDPFVFRNPGDGQIYALFEGNNGGVAGSHTCDPHEIGDVPEDHVVPDDARFYTGNIGLMKRTSRGMNNWTEWELLPPVLSAECTNQQTERPHLTVVDGTYYLWTISHEFTFAPGLTGPDGLYGFAGDSLRSDYEAINGSGLALGNPPSMPLMTYSDYVMPNGLVESFIDTVPTSDGGVRFGGTLAPTYELELDGATSRFVQQWPYGYIPPMRNVAGRPL